MKTLLLLLSSMVWAVDAYGPLTPEQIETAQDAVARHIAGGTGVDLYVVSSIGMLDASGRAEKAKLDLYSYDLGHGLRARVRLSDGAVEHLEPLPAGYPLPLSPEEARRAADLALRYTQERGMLPGAVTVRPTNDESGQRLAIVTIQNKMEMRVLVNLTTGTVVPH